MQSNVAFFFRLLFIYFFSLFFFFFVWFDSHTRHSNDDEDQEEEKGEEEEKKEKMPGEYQASNTDRRQTAKLIGEYTCTHLVIWKTERERHSFFSVRLPLSIASFVYVLDVYDQ